ncbi:uncharacterized protein LOC128198761 [Bicyclus anynana]|uniref:Uncharacterized protein LOC128198761 n=1 Tax=Bicyclus anynana TaxID=110368 RepID=A0ABM3LR82_BICAN|nr:uncharacterized protein LOC128198761 [Bicyclus anynana]
MKEIWPWEGAETFTYSSQYASGAVSSELAACLQTCAAARRCAGSVRSMLAFMLLLHHAAARGSPQEPHVFKNISSCPDVGYYFTTEPVANALEPACLLCFCREDDALCWRRQLSRCDQRYHQLREGKRVHRVRRSPGLADIFFRGTDKDITDLNKNPPEECKQVESSYSIGCPPDDWCVGCTVCDCDANGRWKCHNLSFCDDKGRNKKKTDKIPQRTTKKANARTTKNPIITTSKKINKDKNNPKTTPNKQSAKRKQREMGKTQRKPIKELNKANVISVKKAKSPVYKKKPISKSKGRLNNKKMNTSAKSSSNKFLKGKTKTLNETEQIIRDMAHTIFKKVMASVEKIVMDSQKVITGKISKKGSTLKQYKNEINKKMNTTKSTKINNSIPKNIKNSQMPYTKKNKRDKRELTAVIPSTYYSNEGNIC